MFHKTSLSLAIVILCITRLWQTTTVEGQSTVSIDVYTNPAAMVTIDGKSVGKAPVTVKLTLGKHTFQSSLRGFPEKIVVENIDEASTSIYLDFDDGPDLTRLRGIDPFQTRWTNDGQTVWFAFEDSTDPKQPRIYKTLDVSKKTMSATAHPPDVIDDAALRNSLHTTSLLYKSPSGHYKVYGITVTHLEEVTKRTIANTQLAIADLRTNQQIKTNLTLPYVDDPMLPSYQIVFSPNEKAIWVDTFAEGFASFIYLENGQATDLSAVGFKTEDGQDVYVERALAAPSEQKLAVVRGRVVGDNTKIWLVDLTAMRGQPLPIEGIFAAGFTADGQNICVIHKGGVSRVSVDLKKVELLSDVVSEKWGIAQASLSPTLEYAIVGTDPQEAVYWLYKMPPC
ncbi:MAG: PEGA domain-containing protein [Chloroflexota bacterium]